MRKLFRATLVAMSVALVALTATVPASAAPANGATALSVGQRTSLNESWAWVHFLPTAESDHLTIDILDRFMATMCWTTGQGRIWDLVYDASQEYAGYTYESYLSTGSNQPCSSVGTPTHTNQVAWVHLHPDETWEPQVVNPGDSIGAICSTWFRARWWDLIIDHTNNLVGFTWDSSVAAPRPPECWTQ
jgi:hypothetical protein